MHAPKLRLSLFLAGKHEHEHPDQRQSPRARVEAGEYEERREDPRDLRRDPGRSEVSHARGQKRPQDSAAVHGQGRDEVEDRHRKIQEGEVGDQRLKVCAKRVEAESGQPQRGESDQTQGEGGRGSGGGDEKFFAGGTWMSFHDRGSAEQMQRDSANGDRKVPSDEGVAELVEKNGAEEQNPREHPRKAPIEHEQEDDQEQTPVQRDRDSLYLSDFQHDGTRVHKPRPRRDNPGKSLGVSAGWVGDALQNESLGSIYAVLEPFRRVVALLGGSAAFALIACDVSVPISAVDAGPSVVDAGSTPFDAGSNRISNIIETDRVSEEFENRNFVDALLSESVVIDTNRGVATLPTERFPSLEASSITNLAPTSQFEGVVEGSTILLEPDVQIEAMDAIELRAAETLRLSGRLRAGPGGVTLVAGRSIFVDGRIESEGPIRLRLASVDGLIDVSGKLLTTSGRSEQSSEITLIGRGAIEVSGEIRTGDGESGSGPVLLSSYRSIALRGELTLVASGASELGTAGSVRLLSEEHIELAGGATAATGVAAHEAPGQVSESSGGSDVELRAVQDVRLTEGSRLLGAQHTTRSGGTVRVIAGRDAEFRGAALIGGAGGVGGGVIIEARTASIGPEVSLLAGAGKSGGGDVELKTARGLHMAQLMARAGATECGVAGSVRIHVGGPTTLDSGVSLNGGTGGRGMNRCIEGARGGDVVVLVQSGNVAALTEASTPGYGAGYGERSITIDPEYERPMPDVRVQTLGFLVSKIIDRGAGATGITPRLESFLHSSPSATVAKLQVAGAENPEGPFEPWLDASVEENGALSALAGARYFRFRLWLQGRALDAPEVDAFELALGTR